MTATPALFRSRVPASTSDVVADIVTDVVAATYGSTVIHSRNRLHSPWGLEVSSGEVVSIHVITTGTCWLVVDGGEPVHLAQNDVVLVPFGVRHALIDTPGRSPRPAEELLGAPLGHGTPRELVIDGPGPLTGMLCGGFLPAAGPRHPLTALLPPVVHIPAGDAGGPGMAATIELLAVETDRAYPSGRAVVESLLKLLHAYILRAWFARQGPIEGGWPQALHDPSVGGALALIHSDPARPWTVASLARSVDVPRATFGRRFTALTGQAPMTYVTMWRMTVAARLLREQRTPLRDIAQQIGYHSEYAFARTFKRIHGQAPGRYRTAARRQAEHQDAHGISQQE
jgi:AraC-like DNA-binding protein